VARKPAVAPPLTRPTATLSPLRGARDAHVTPRDTHVTPRDAHVTPRDAHVTPRETHVTPRDTLPLAGEGGAKRQVRVAHYRKPYKPATAVARIELHTADPDVRIIWITN